MMINRKIHNLPNSCKNLRFKKILKFKIKDKLETRINKKNRKKIQKNLLKIK